MLLFDEPLNGLDPEGVKWVRDLFKRLAAEGRTVFVSSHLMSEMEHTADQLVVIGGGELIAAQSLSEFSARGTRWSVTVTTPAAGVLADLLAAEGGAVRRGGVQLTVTGLSAVRIGDIARQHGLALHQLGEYSTGTIRTTFAAVPARRSVMAAKAVVLTLVTTVFGTLVSGVSFAVTQAILGRRSVGVSIGDPGAFRVVLASALLAPVCALTGLALGAAIRQTAATLITSVVVILVLPLVITDGRHWSAVVQHTLPYPAWLRLTDAGYSSTGFPWTAAGAWTVYAVWACAACAIAVISVHRRDQ